ncbi:hypothetical protein ACLOJK_020710 [Asimina triloba]
MGGGAPKEKEASVELVGQGSTALDKGAEERLARQEKADLQASLAVSCEEARRSGLIVASLEVTMELGPLGPTPSFMPVADIEVAIMSPKPAFEGESSEASSRDGTEASSCPSNDRLFRWPFDMEERALKILGDLLPVQSRGIRECHTLGFAPSLDKEGRGAGERMLQEYLPDAEYRYHVLGECVRLSVGQPHVWDLFRTSNIMNKGERRKIVAAEKYPKETGVEQVSREVLRFDASVPSKWKLLEEALAKARSMARERLKLDEAQDNAEGISLAKQELEQALVEATMEADNLCLQKFSAEDSLRHLFDQVGHAREEVSRLSFKPGAMRVLLCLSLHKGRLVD